MFFTEEPGKDQCAAKFALLPTLPDPLTVADRIDDVATVLAALSADMRESFRTKESIPRKPAALNEVAHAVLSARAARAAFIGPDLIGEPAWDILLAVASDQASTMSVKAVINLSRTPHATATRWIALLEQRGLIAVRRQNIWRRSRRRLAECGPRLGG
jgi:hypothetical protein